MKIDLNRDWSEFLCALIARRARFVMIAGVLAGTLVAGALLFAPGRRLQRAITA